MGNSTEEFATQKRPRALWLQRFWTHITRKRARIALLITALAGVAYLLVPQTWPGESTIHEFLLIFAGVSASAVFLPELSGDLWSLNSATIRRLVPESRREQLSRALVGAESLDEDWNDSVYSRGVEPLLEASKSPYQVLKDLNYRVDISLNEQINLGSGGELEIHLIQTELHARRVLPSSRLGEDLWIAAVRSESALGREFLEPRCLLRERVVIGDLVGREWWEAVKTHCEVHLHLDAAPEDVMAQDYDPAQPDVVRWSFSPGAARRLDKSIPVQIEFTFPIAADLSNFPVVLGSYYSAGATRVTAKIYPKSNRQSPLNVGYQAFLGQALGRSAPVLSTRTSACHRLSFTTDGDGLIWPGSGIMFWWDNEYSATPDGETENSESRQTLEDSEH